MKRLKLIITLKKEDGAGLVLALMVLMVLAVLGVTVAAVTIGSHKLGHINRDSNSAYYIAEAGANLAYEEIKSGVIPAYETSANSDLNYFGQITQLVREVDGSTYTDFSDQFGDQPIATVAIEPTPSNDVKEYTIVSTGEINGTSRTVKKPFTVNWVKNIGGIGLPPLPENCAIYVNELNIDLLSFVFSYPTVVGDIITHSKYNVLEKTYNLIKINHTPANKKGIIYSKDFNLEPYREIKRGFPVYDNFLAELRSDEEYIEYTETIQSSGMNVISSNSIIPTLKINKNSPLTIDTGTEGRTISLIVNHLDVNDNIIITGTGTVNLYVKSTMKIASRVEGLRIGGDRVGQLNIVYAGGAQASIGNQQLFPTEKLFFRGTIFSQNAKIIFYNNVELEGIIVIFGGNLEMVSDIEVTAIIYAPESEVVMSASSKLNGGMVAKRVQFWGSNKVQYALNEEVKQYLFGTGTGETPDLEELIFSQAAIEP